MVPLVIFVRWVVLVQLAAAQDIFLSSLVGTSQSFTASPSPPSPPSGNVFMPDCDAAAEGWPKFDDASSLANDTVWSSYFMTVYGEIPQSGYPICTGSFTQIPLRGGITQRVTHCMDSTVNEGALFDALSTGLEPSLSGRSLVTYIYNSKNLGYAVPENYWVEIQHVSSSYDNGAKWYYVTLGSAIWWNVGRTVVFHDHADVSQSLLGHTCRKTWAERLHGWLTGTSAPSTECGGDFSQWYKRARSLGYDSIQMTHHYDCICGQTGPSSVMHNRLCPTEIVDVNGDASHGACPHSQYKAGWEASRDCNCNNDFTYTNCGNFGLR